ncbi:MAG: DUF6377 domain-containing protein [Muribaculum sp.]|nr:DUF6377 domain-containing protein [Muribaculum sp.]
MEMQSLVRLFFFIALLVQAHNTVFCAPPDFSHLDEMLKHDFVGIRQSRIDSIRKVTAGRDKWLQFYSLATAYTDLNVDSALIFINKAIESASDDKARRKALLVKASIYNGSLMMYKEASDIFNSLEPNPSDPSYTADYYTLGVQLYKNLEEYSPEEPMRREYADIKRAMRDSVLKIHPDAILIEANNHLDDGNVAKALELLLPEVNGKEFKPSNGAIYHVIALAYQMQGNTPKEIEYLTLAAEADIANGVREYIALPRLAYLLYLQGDIERAYKYMLRSYEDARACNARIRLANMSEAMAVISGAHNARHKTSLCRTILLVILLVIMLIVLGILFIYSRRRNHMLNLSRKRLQEVNAQLEADRSLREKYGRRFMQLSLEFMDRLNSYRLHLLKIASKRNFDKLYDAISSTSTMDHDADIFYRNFDSSFLDIYPDFVDEINSMMRPEEKIKIPDNNTLTTELRILALMKLGISESSEIAKLLHCSQSTVYNYRTRFRAKAIDKVDFVKKIFGNTPTSPPTF